MLHELRHESPAHELPGGLHAPAQARRHVSGLLDGQLDPGSMYELELLVSEVVTNAVVHGGAGEDDTIALSVDLRPDRVWIAVSDPGEGFERPIIPVAHAHAGGNGLVLLQELASDWDVERGERTRVWFELEREPERALSAA